MPIRRVDRRWSWLLGLLALLFSMPAFAAPSCLGVAPGATARVAVGDTGRALLLHVPQGYRGGRAPLVFLFHGSGSTAAEMLRVSQLDEVADRHGFLVAAPDAGIPLERGFAWNIPGVPTVAGTIPTEDDPDDVAYIEATIDSLSAQGCVDTARVYATGLSGGGRMTSWLGCVAADRFAAIAPVVGLRAGNPLASDPTQPDPATCQPSRAVPVIAFAGDKDTTNPIEGGGAGYWQYTMEAALQRWATLNGCAPEPSRTEFGERVLEVAYIACRDRAAVVGWIVHGRGHEWVLDGDAMWRFFERHRR